MAIEHSSIPDNKRHEPKGASTATLNHVLTSNGDTTTSFRRPVIMGWYNYDNSGSSVALTTAGTFYDLNNNALGPQTILSYALPGVATIWNTSTNRFDFTSLSVGDKLDIRLDYNITTTTSNSAIDIVLELAVGSGTPIILPIITLKDYKTAGTYQHTISLNSFIGSDLIKNNPARFKAKADKTGVTIDVNGWFVAITRRGDY